MNPLTPEQTAELLHGTPVTAVETPAPAEQETVEAPVVAEPAPKPTEALKAVSAAPGEFEFTKDGKTHKVTIVKPAKATSLHVSKVLGMRSMNPMLDMYYKAMMWVRVVNGHNIPFLGTDKQFEGLSELLGDEGIEALMTAVNLAEVEAESFDWEAVKKS